LTDWSDPASRLALAERVSTEEYNRQAKEARDASIIETVAGHALRPANSRFGRLISVGDLGMAFLTIEEARAHALANPASGEADSPLR
jgi:hypothetical protein